MRLGRPVVVFNMAEIGHTSRDSDAKYRVLDGSRFDLVFFYHGINDARANNVPSERFRRDYSHYAWYDALRALETCRDDGLFVLPCTLRFLWVRANDALGIVDYVSMDAPRPDWLAYGAEIQSAASFEENLRGIVARASDPGVPLFDQASAMPKGARYFNDVCHLAATGSSVFVQNMLDTAVEIVSAPHGAR